MPIERKKNSSPLLLSKKLLLTILSVHNTDRKEKTREFSEFKSASAPGHVSLHGYTISDLLLEMRDMSFVLTIHHLLLSDRVAEYFICLTQLPVNENDDSLKKAVGALQDMTINKERSLQNMKKKHWFSVRSITNSFSIFRFYMFLRLIK